MVVTTRQYFPKGRPGLDWIQSLVSVQRKKYYDPSEENQFRVPFILHIERAVMSRIFYAICRFAFDNKDDKFIRVTYP